MFFRNGLAAAAVAAISLSTSALGVSATSRPIKRTSGDACAKIAEAFANGETSVPAEDAHLCMTSIPFDPKRSLYIAENIRKFSQIYSAQAFFYDPPTEQLKIKAVDLNGTFAEIEKKSSKQDGYANDYEFQKDLINLFESFHDGHVYYSPNCAAQFKFYHDYPLVSVLKEGQDLPTIHIADPDTGEVGDEVEEINGEKVYEHLERLASELPGLPWIDPDARYNELLMTKHPVNGISRGVFAWRSLFYEKSFPIKLKGGKTIDVQWMAYIFEEPIYTDTQEYLDYVCLDAYYEDVIPSDGGEEEDPEAIVKAHGNEHHHKKPKKHHQKPKKHHQKPKEHHKKPKKHHQKPKEHHKKPKKHHKKPHHEVPKEEYESKSYGWDLATTEEHPTSKKHHKQHEENGLKGPYENNHHIPKEVYNHNFGFNIASHEQHPSHGQQKHGSHKKPEHKSSDLSTHRGHHGIPKETAEHKSFGWNTSAHHRRSLDRAVERRLNEEAKAKKLRKRNRHPVAEYYHHTKPEDEVYHAKKGSDEPQDEGTPIEEEEEEKISTIPNVEPAVPWPELAVKMNGNEQTLYKLNDNTVVWGIHAFADLDGSEEFFQHWQDFIDEAFEYCKENKITHVIIDVTGNGGGYVSLGIATIKQFFPKAHPYYGFDIRRSPAMDLLIEYSADSDDSHLDLNDTKNIDNKDFASIEEFLGPVYKYGDYFTAIGRWDPEDNIRDIGLEIPDHKDPFSKDNIILLSDGRCGSTCAIFGEAISNIGVKSISTNGIPDGKQGGKYMQHVGGIKGSQVWPWDTFMTSHVEAYIENPEQYDFLPKRLPINHASSMNLRNSYEPGSDVPLEFIWQPANAHFYLTEKMWTDQAKVWEKAYSMAWDKDGKNILKDLPDEVVKASNQHKAGLKSDKGEPKGGHEQIVFSGHETWGYFINLWFQSIKEELPKF